MNQRLPQIPRFNAEYSGSAKKTLHWQSFESAFAPDTKSLACLEVEDPDPLLWPRVGPPDYDRASIYGLPERGEATVSLFQRFPKKNISGSQDEVTGRSSRILGVRLYWKCIFFLTQKCMYRTERRTSNWNSESCISISGVQNHCYEQRPDHRKNDDNNPYLKFWVFTENIAQSSIQHVRFSHRW